MRRGSGVVLTGLLALAALLALTALSRDTRAQQPSAARSRGEVIMIRCNTGEATFPVRAYQGSTAAPAKRSDSCPETLSLLRKEGFRVEHVGYSDHDSDFVVFTLAR